MRDEDFRESLNIEDRRDNGGNGGGFGGGGLPVRTGGGFGMIIVVILMLLFGGGKNLLGALSAPPTLGSGQSEYSSSGYQQEGVNGIETANNSSEAEARTAKRVARVLGANEDYWTAYFKQNGGEYNPPVLVIFNNRTSSPCGTASGATGPFYCPSDSKVYLDMGFFDDMRRSLGASGDFAEAYVIAHEIGHHVQDEIGILGKAHKAMSRSGEDKGADSLAVRIELQADCFAGTWAKNAVANTGALEQGDVEEAMQAANSVGDDRLQKQSQGYAVPDSFTHGTSEQRMRWFNIGLKSGNPETCDTFSARSL